MCLDLRIKMKVSGFARLFNGRHPRVGDCVQVPVITDFRGPRSDVKLMVTSLKPPELEFIEESILVSPWPDIQVERFAPKEASIKAVRREYACA